MANNGHFYGGMATGLSGGMKLAKEFKEALARYHVDQAARAKVEQINAQGRDAAKVADANAGATDAPLTSAAAASPAMASPEIAPVQSPEVESRALESAPGAATITPESGTFSPDQWSAAPETPATVAPSFDIQAWS